MTEKGEREALEHQRKADQNEERRLQNEATELEEKRAHQEREDQNKMLHLKNQSSEIQLQAKEKERAHKIALKQAENESKKFTNIFSVINHVYCVTYNNQG